MKRIVSLILALSMVLSMFTVSFAGASLKDVEGTKYQSAVEALIELGVVDGYPDGTYLPENKVTRAELAKLLVIAYGLSDAADAAGVITPFADANNHWASGYVNVSADYQFVNGYPDGSFQPNGTVTYAEAVTMCLRVLGYAKEVDSKGTWPTNYIAKARDLKLLNDIEYNSITDGATRGNVALLIWNMLRTEMWEVTSESEGDGLQSKPNREMLNVKFSDYSYDKDATFEGFDINEDGEVEISLGFGRYDEDDELITLPYEYAKNDFYTFVQGTEVEVLVNEKEDTLLTIVPNGEDTLVDGDVADINEEYKAQLDGEYAYARIYRNKVAASTVLEVVNSYVEEVKTTSKKFTAKGFKTFSYDEYDDEVALFLLDGERVTFEAIEEGDIVSTVTVAGVSEPFYVISRDLVEGSLDKVTTEQVKGEDERFFITVDGEEYESIPAYVIEVDEDDNETNTNLADIQDDDESKFYGEEATLSLDFLGRVQRIVFPEIEDKEEVGNFYVISNGTKATWEVSNEDGETTYIKLNDESYEVKDGADITGTLTPGAIVLAKFDSKDRVKEIKVVAKYDAEAADITVTDEDYKFALATSYDEDAEFIKLDTTEYPVVSSTKVVKVTKVKDDEDDEEKVTGYTYEIVDADELEGLDKILVAYKADDDFKNVKYAFVWDDSQSNDLVYGLVEKYSKENGLYYLTIDGTTYEIEDGSASDKAYVGKVVAFVENADGITVKDSYGVEELAKADVVTAINKENSRIITLEKYGTVNLNGVDANDDLRVFYVDVALNDDEAYEIDDLEETSIDEVKFNEDDLVATDNHVFDAETLVILVIRGYEAE